ncbi:hypothetical protein [Acinetobacter proteolyticus]|uniref:Uncharacterized protein n=1 Tax=Acinetobacter proteolyticus TaxID=1776741 RepID=A0A2N0WID6_9GAMM|nr:hypothetical protein [Acinetobacter proteolyticus]PKF35567.1 hypothetical protein CW311_04570 [Acinetobacter proteolyticus]
MPARQYNKQSTTEVNNFMAAFQENAQDKGTFDSASAKSFINEALSQNTVPVPKAFQAVLDSASDGEADQIMRAVMDGEKTIKLSTAKKCQPMF